MGVDIGQKRDPTAIAVAELVARHNALAPSTIESHYCVRHLERLPLGTPYPQVARRIAEICQRLTQQNHNSPYLYLDATGVGQPIVDLLDQAHLDAKALCAVFFTHGHRRIEHLRERKITLGKAYLVSRLQALLQGRRLHLPPTAEARALANELLDYEIRVDENANDRYGAFRVGTHDDLVTALGLAVHKEPRAPQIPTT